MPTLLNMPYITSTVSANLCRAARARVGDERSARARSATCAASLHVARGEEAVENEEGDSQRKWPKNSYQPASSSYIVPVRERFSLQVRDLKVLSPQFRRRCAVIVMGFATYSRSLLSSLCQRCRSRMAQALVVCVLVRSRSAMSRTLRR